MQNGLGLVENMIAVARSELNSFDNEFVTLELKQVKEHYNDNRLLECLKTFVTRQEFLKVGTMHQKLMKKHAIELA